MRFWILGALSLGLSATSFAGPRDQAKKIYDRLAGVPPTSAELDQMTAMIEAGDVRGAADLAMNSETFLSVTVKNMVARWTNIEENIDVPLNDFSATVIGLVRDELGFDQLLYGDIVYTGADNLGLPAYSTANNDHYSTFEAQGQSFKTNLVQKTQTATTGLTEQAGVYTTRGFGEAFFSAGTNRRAIEGSMKLFTCRSMEQLNDVTRSDAFVRRDVDRAPGGDPKAFRNKCAGCHSGMDPLTKAFAYYDFVDGQLTITPGEIPEKINRNGSTFPQGYVTDDDQWHLMWAEGQNATVGWNGASSGAGAAELGKMISETEAFPVCMAQRVFNKVCLRGPASKEEAESLKELATTFKENGFNMKDLFAGSAELCIVE